MECSLRIWPRRCGAAFGHPALVENMNTLPSPTIHCPDNLQSTSTHPGTRPTKPNSLGVRKTTSKRRENDQTKRASKVLDTSYNTSVTFDGHSLRITGGTEVETERLI